MSRILLRPQAHEDLVEIGIYIELDSPRLADEFVALIESKISVLAEHPQMGRVREEGRLAGLNLRSHPVGNYLIFYRAIPDGVEVVRILHGNRNLGVIEF